MRKLSILAMLAVGCLLASSANAARVGVFVGVPLWDPGYYGPPAYYPPPVYYNPPPVYVESAPPVYVQQNAESNNYWYYCKESKAYYPYAQSCPSNWMKVVPNSPGSGQPPPQ